MFLPWQLRWFRQPVFYLDISWENFPQNLSSPSSVPSKYMAYGVSVTRHSPGSLHFPSNGPGLDKPLFVSCAVMSTMTQCIRWYLHWCHVWIIVTVFCLQFTVYTSPSATSAIRCCKTSFDVAHLHEHMRHLFWNSFTGFHCQAESNSNCALILCVYMLYAYIVVVYFAFDKVFIKEFCYYCRRSWRIVTVVLP